LRFVGNPESVAFGGEGSDGRQEFTAERVDPALALNGLGDDGYQVFIGGGVQGGDVVGGNEHDAGDEREKGLAVFGFGGEGKGSVRATVEAVLEGDDPVAAATVFICLGAGGFQGRLHCFGAAVAQEDFR